MDEKVAIYHFKMPSQYLLTSTFLRFQEFYESPRFQGCYFSLEEFQDWYVTTRPNGQFSYYTDWSGFNFPSHVVDTLWRGGFGGGRSRKESWVLEQLWSRGATGKYYVIGTYDDRVTSHEIVHGLFYLNESYAKAIHEIIVEYDFEEFKQALRLAGYCEEVLVDEINAYLTTGLMARVRGKSVASAQACKPRLMQEFKKAFGFNIGSKVAARRFAEEAIHVIDGGSIQTPIAPISNTR
jgi:hypothetical protein